MEMFDGLIWVGVLGCMFFSTEPKRTAMFCVLVCHTVTVIVSSYDPQFLGAWSSFYISGFAEFAGAAFLIWYSRRIFHDRLFFFMMSFLLWFSALTGGMYKYDFINAYSEYETFSEAIAIIHLFIMLMFTDGIRNSIGYIYDSLSAVRRRWSHS